MIFSKYPIQLILIALLSVTTFSACNEEGCMDETAHNFNEDATKDDGSCEFLEDLVEFNVQSPQAHTDFDHGDVVEIKATINSAEDVHGYAVYIRNKSDNNAVVFEADAHVHDNPVEIDETWTNNMMGHSDMELEIILFVGHDDEEDQVSTKVHFHCHPEGEHHTM